MLPSFLETHFRKQFQIYSAENVSGGCINECFRLNTSKGLFFLKLNEAAAFPGMFDAEMQGLKLLASTKEIRVPVVYETGIVDTTAFLFTEFVERGSTLTDSSRNFGRKLAALHQHSAGYFGLEYDNYIGSLPQQNTRTEKWPDFFVQSRLIPQIELARKNGLLENSTEKKFESLFKKINTLFPEEKPSLLHGDLWSGNYFWNKDGEPCLFDPAVYYGHREMDIAMTLLFENFGNDFYTGYNEIYPLQNGWKERIALCNLYPLLVHVNLFGSGYLSQLSHALNKYV
jgi:protein-ribulosamine 3-kinase